MRLVTAFDHRRFSPRGQALSRYVATSAVTLAADVLTAGTAGRGNATGTDAAGAWDTTGPQVIPTGTVLRHRRRTQGYRRGQP
jgi:hypothetical protein